MSLKSAVWVLVGCVGALCACSSGETSESASEVEAEDSEEMPPSENSGNNPGDSPSTEEPVNGAGLGLPRGSTAMDDEADDSQPAPPASTAAANTGGEPGAAAPGGTTTTATPPDEAATVGLSPEQAEARLLFPPAADHTSRPSCPTTVLDFSQVEDREVACDAPWTEQGASLALVVSGHASCGGGSCSDGDFAGGSLWIAPAEFRVDLTPQDCSVQSVELSVTDYASVAYLMLYSGSEVIAEGEVRESGEQVIRVDVPAGGALTAVGVQGCETAIHSVTLN